MTILTPAVLLTHFTAEAYILEKKVRQCKIRLQEVGWDFLNIMLHRVACTAAALSRAHTSPHALTHCPPTLEPLPCLLPYPSHPACAGDVQCWSDAVQFQGP